MNFQLFSANATKLASYIIILPLLVTLAACGGGASEESTASTNNGNGSTPNQAPTANAGQDITVNENANVDLAATGTDNDGTISAFNWTQSAGPTVQLSAATSANTSFTAPTLESGQTSVTLSFTVTVTDNDGATATDSVSVTVNAASTNHAPIVDAGSDKTVAEQTNVELVATASDSDGDNLTYLWQQVSGQTVTLQHPDLASVTFTAPVVGGGSAVSQTLTFSITATDDQGASSEDTINVTVSADNVAPTADAGADQTVTQGANVSLTATASDSDGSVTNYQWTQTAGNNVTLSGADSANASFVAPNLSNPDVAENYSFELTVTDNEGATATDSLTITVAATGGGSSEGCDVTVSPGESFSDTFNTMQDGQTLCLNDGVYTQEMDIPSNMHVKAVHDGMAEIDGGSSLGVPWDGAILQLHGSNSSVRGLKVHHAGENSDACSIGGTNNIMQVMSCSHGGTHKHKIPMKISGSGHLIEDSWFYGEGRYVVQCFGGTNITIRRNVARWDSTAPNESSEPNAAFSIYACSEMTVENNISLDYGVPETAMRYGGDFYEPAHSGTGYVPDNNYFLGNIAINHAQGTDNNRAMRFDPDMETSGNVVKDFYVRDVNMGFVVTPKMIGLTFDGCTMVNATIGTYNGNNIDCGGEADISVRYVDRVKTTDALFPWPNQDLIKADMCASGERQSDWCTTTKSLTDYVLNQ